MELTIFQVDAFAEGPFQGNPAAVCPLEAWLDDERLQAIAAENNLSETAYVVGRDGSYQLRWFTPQVEVDLCGHATLATAWVLIHKLGDSSPVLRFATRSGELRVRRDGERLAMDFPARQPQPCAAPAGLLEALGIAEAEVLKTDDYLVVVGDEDAVAALAPDFARLKGLPCRGVAVTARSRRFDFVSRWFGPNVGVNEDPVTGSAHTSLAPYWAQRLGKTRLSAEQGGARRGRLECEVLGERVVISGTAALYMSGTLYL
ncbi:PhzF family phenazine biosynthesis protein [Pseudomonas paraeruginosa]|uniref:Phenazine biosynthesis, PhzF family protein n=1 Tax=Pseudomonas paraeruginosa TaxID=2994495 RepID=A0A2R3INR6_9PSED|nr:MULTISPECIES: PhzF family phenazine biosynthesis protein [Pseudomonas aeruginosa group]AVK03566.1 phenazine biosynthesis, PhzF family protein [Pseudomonas paraeruginosa]AWE93535.1 phenazine biosynthesis, PhzF family protein [Pseudomonas paraeruginosa]KAB0742331.1 PhzF family phenazine biosynthesis protein [Pseudomonas aeruginosa]KSD72324.1 isomerase [Pseudomonas aeruginosa]MBG4067631.1 PhzF family phenazine biosynthesis protein [Pseudomonas aeruginosa]